MGLVVVVKWKNEYNWHLTGPQLIKAIIMTNSKIFFGDNNIIIYFFCDIYHFECLSWMFHLFLILLFIFTLNIVFLNFTF